MNNLDHLYNRAMKIILDNWTSKEDVVLNLIKSDLNTDQIQSQKLYNDIMDHLISEVKIR